jgi:hypothetical protein
MIGHRLSELFIINAVWFGLERFGGRMSFGNSSKTVLFTHLSIPFAVLKAYRIKSVLSV